MNREEFRAQLRHHGITVEEFALFLGRRVDTVYRYGETQAVPVFARNVLALLDLKGGADALRHVSVTRCTRDNPLESSDNP